MSKMGPFMARGNSNVRLRVTGDSVRIDYLQNSRWKMMSYLPFPLGPALTADLVRWYEIPNPSAFRAACRKEPHG